MKANCFRQLPSLGAAFLICSCSSYQQQAGLVGGLVGAGLGAAFGDDHQDVVGGAAVGAAVGAGGAALHEQSRRTQYGQYDRYGNGAPPQGYQQRQPPRSTADSSGQYPLARRTSNPNEVESPYPPHHRINVSGFRSGDLAKDPKNGRVFQIP